MIFLVAEYLKKINFDRKNVGYAKVNTKNTGQNLFRT